MFDIDAQRNWPGDDQSGWCGSDDRARASMPTSRRVRGINAVTNAQIVEFLKALRAQLRHKLPVVWDGAPQHKSRIVREYLDGTEGAVQMALLPAYSPNSTRSKRSATAIRQHRLLDTGKAVIMSWLM